MHAHTSHTLDEDLEEAEAPGLRVLMSARRRCNNGRGDVMHEPKVSALHYQDHYCIVREHSLQHVSLANCHNL